MSARCTSKKYNNHLIIHFSPHYLSNSRLRDVENKGKFQTFSSKSGRGRLREVVGTRDLTVFPTLYFLFNLLTKPERVIDRLWSLLVYNAIALIQHGVIEIL